MKKKLMHWICACVPALVFLPFSVSAAGYAETRYPIVLVHGLFGFDAIGPVDYFYRVPATLRADGARVFVPSVSAANSTEVRGEQLLAQIKQIRAITGASKVNLIGHSHGSPTARYVASTRPDLVASVTSVGGVNKSGSPVADAVLGTLSNPVMRSALNGLGTLLSVLSGSSSLPQRSVAAFTSLSTEGTLKFNRAHPQGIPNTACGEGDYVVNGVRYFSWSGVKPYTNPFDPTDPAFVLTSLLFRGTPNDGLVSTCSTHLGQVIRDNYAMNHLDEVNMMVGLVNLFETNPITLYRQQANRLKNLGL